MTKQPHPFDLYINPQGAKTTKVATPTQPYPLTDTELAVRAAEVAELEVLLDLIGCRISELQDELDAHEYACQRGNNG
jgi:hypothetical protein